MMRIPRFGTRELERYQHLVAGFAPKEYYDSDYRAMERMYLPAVFRALRGHAPGRVLEIGPGWGTTAAWLTDAGHDVTVIDLMPVGTFISNELLDHIGVTYLHHDIEDAPAPEGADLGRFDIVIMTQVIPHLAWRPDRALRHARALINDRGTFVASVLDRANYGDLAAAFGDDWHAVPEWRTAPRNGEVVKCMYTRESFLDLISTVFDQTSISKPFRSKVLLAEARS